MPLGSSRQGAQALAWQEVRCSLQVFLIKPVSLFFSSFSARSDFSVLPGLVFLHKQKLPPRYCGRYFAFTAFFFLPLFFSFTI